MKKSILIATLTLTTAVSAMADQNNSLGGLVLGAGGGALVGQAIGRNTESTVVGTAVGGVIGYIIGSEMDREGRQVHRVPAPAYRPVVHKQEQVIQYNHYYEPIESRPALNNRCKQTKILGTINGRPRNIYGTVCRTPRGWELVSEGPTVYDDTRYKKSRHRKQRNFHHRHSPKKAWKKQGWARHRF